MANKALKVGCVADDFTGASDAASFLTHSNAKCLLINGIPSDECIITDEYDSVVIALKTRSEQAEVAIKKTEKAFEWLKKRGANVLYFKYCSTFDSTPEGNIGPVMDSLLEKFHMKYSILCPALPVNGRTVKDGILYVDNIPLAQSHMRHHPLNPMLESDVALLMGSQSRYPSYHLTFQMLEKSDEEIQTLIQEWCTNNKHFYIVTDYFEERHGYRIADLFMNLPLISGGSALMEHIYNAISNKHTAKEMNGLEDTTLILSGSCSKMTISQIHYFIEHGGNAKRIFANDLIEGKQTCNLLWEFVIENVGKPVLLYSYQAPGELVEKDKYSQQQISDALEELNAQLGKLAIKYGIKRIVVAGGETSGAVMQALQGNVYEIDQCVAPGVPIMKPLENKEMQLVLKSGNFGQEDFFFKSHQIMKSLTSR